MLLNLIVTEGVIKVSSLVPFLWNLVFWVLRVTMYSVQTCFALLWRVSWVQFPVQTQCSIALTRGRNCSVITYSI